MIKTTLQFCYHSIPFIAVAVFFILRAEDTKRINKNFNNVEKQIQSVTISLNAQAAVNEAVYKIITAKSATSL